MTIVEGRIEPIDQDVLLGIKPNQLHKDVVDYCAEDEDEYVLEDILYFKSALYLAEKEARKRGLIK